MTHTQRRGTDLDPKNRHQPVVKPVSFRKPFRCINDFIVDEMHLFMERSCKHLFNFEDDDLSDDEDASELTPAQCTSSYSTVFYGLNSSDNSDDEIDMGWSEA